MTLANLLTQTPATMQHNLLITADFHLTILCTGHEAEQLQSESSLQSNYGRVHSYPWGVNRMTSQPCVRVQTPQRTLQHHPQIPSQAPLYHC